MLYSTLKMAILANWVLSALTILLISQYLLGFNVNSFVTALIVALVLGIINAFIKPVIVILTLPINILTLGLFTFVINAFLIRATAYIVPGFEVHGFLPALIGAFLLWLISTVVNFVAFPIKPR